MNYYLIGTTCILYEIVCELVGVGSEIVSEIFNAAWKSTGNSSEMVLNL